MYRFRAHTLPLLGFVFVASLAGCGQAGLPTEVTDLLNPADGTTDVATLQEALKDSDVLKALQTTVSADANDVNAAVEQVAVDVLNAGDMYADSADVPVAVASEDILDEVTEFPEQGLVAHGILRGRFWGRDPNANSDAVGGVFRGRWLDSEENVLGFIHGHYHPLVRPDLPPGLTGGGVFRGVHVDVAGQFRGFLRGRYGYGPEGAQLFYGRWFDRNDHLIGVLKGVWQDQPDTTGGGFAGRWAAIDICEEVASLPEFVFDEGDFGGLDAEPNDVAALSDLPIASGEELGFGLGGANEDWGVEAAAQLPPLPDCIDPNQPFGFLRGHYRPAPPPDPNDPADPNAPEVNGHLRARWGQINGQSVGKLRGFYVKLPPPDPNDPNAPPAADPPTEGRLLGKFYARYINSSGQFAGLIRGVYGRGVHNVGVFRGMYFDVNGVEQGTLIGHWRIAPERPGGPFGGVWFGTELDDGEAAFVE